MTDQKTPRGTSSFDWRFWMQWLLVTAFGWLLGWRLLGLEIVAGVVIGLLQGVALIRVVPRPDYWMLASALGWAFSWFAVIANPSLRFGGLGGAILGAGTGIAQWLVLRNWVHRAWWWIIISTLGWAVAWSGTMGDILPGVIIGAVTGITLEMLLRNQR
jgi:hypothetical protein